MINCFGLKDLSIGALTSGLGLTTSIELLLACDPGRGAMEKNWGFCFFDQKSISNRVCANFGKIANYDNLVMRVG